MPRRKSHVEILADVWGRLVPCHWVRRTLVAVCGPVAEAVPILVRWSGSRQRALRTRDTLRRCGFRVRLRKQRKSNGAGVISILEETVASEAEVRRTIQWNP